MDGQQKCGTTIPEYKEGDKITINGDITLYQVWEEMPKIKVNVEADANAHVEKDGSFIMYYAGATNISLIGKFNLSKGDQLYYGMNGKATSPNQVITASSSGSISYKNTSGENILIDSGGCSISNGTEEWKRENEKEIVNDHEQSIPFNIPYNTEICLNLNAYFGYVRGSITVKNADGDYYMFE